MMITRISPRDWENLSAYIDDQLSPRERSRLEARLRQSLEMRNALEELRRTRQLLRSLPAVHAPRNFTLTPEMVGVRREVPRSYPVLRLVSAMATMLLVLVMVGDFIAPRFGSMPSAQPYPASGIVLEAVPEMAPEEPRALVSGEESTVEQTTEKSVEAEALDQASETPDDGVGMMAASPEATQEIEFSMVPPEEEPQPQLSLREAPADPPPSAELAMPAAEDDTRLYAEEETELVRNVDWNLIQVLQVTLALVALVTGLAALYVRRAAS